MNSFERIKNSYSDSNNNRKSNFIDFSILLLKIGDEDCNHKAVDEAMQTFLQLAIIISLADNFKPLIHQAPFPNMLQSHMAFQSSLVEYKTNGKDDIKFSPVKAINRTGNLRDIFDAKHSFLITTMAWMKTHLQYLEKSYPNHQHITNTDIADATYEILDTANKTVQTPILPKYTEARNHRDHFTCDILR
jgi:hypothetical protein